MDIAAERKHGYEDAQGIISDTAVQACTAKCKWLIFSGHVAAAERCMGPCDERLPRLWQCNDLSWLPF
ncbi:protein of unknown function [Paraburkholderia kururiensis]|uniref:hypothetical protein n=1 Tax=Paraburkholderia kururiensis TaxID=984307 RepID=UPI0039A63D05